MATAGEVFALRVNWRAKLVLLALVLVEAGKPATAGGVPLAWRIAERTGLPVVAVEECLAKLRAVGALRQKGRRGIHVELAALPKQRPFRGRREGSRCYRLNLAALPTKRARGKRGAR